MAHHTLNPSNQEVEAGRTLSVPEHSRLLSEALFQNKKCIGKHMHSKETP